ncbi:hypothetical protein CERZMDRAFT_53029 [Cercospora zeae-maydis SCOH1-5]|uniref:Uncharacterized protein n=1 Tax=Cercospora zeae-maydis SCOH1-5 TaxID=717836 RepID=A0A6A6EW43_9PEZI|nr:hypothetical protein CERZMDRAFT_53029 [Cercospora zeae-maydis SCOH1-5]
MSTVVITGIGGMGLAIARRLGSGRRLLLADYSQDALKKAATTFGDAGFNVNTKQVDVADAESVRAFAEHAKSLGKVEIVVHTAGISPTGGPASRIYDINLVGTIHVMDAFRDIIAPGGSMVCMASTAGHVELGLPAEVKNHLTTSPPSKVLDTPAIDLEKDDGQKAYCVSKVTNIMRVRAAAAEYGKRNVRINTISPGFISTPMGQDLLEGAMAEQIGQFIETTPLSRKGTEEDIADAVVFLTSPQASFITGTDLLIDGGATAASPNFK